MENSNNPSKSSALDGYRALAVSVVMLNHTRLGDGYPTWMTLLDPFLRGGVTAFMVLSGYLVTSSLLREEAQAGAIDLRRFLGKQAVRFYLPALGYLTISLGIWGWQTPGFNWWAALRVLWASPWTGDTPSGVTALTGHLYSLAAQVQFCLWWPLLLCLLPLGRRFVPVTVIMLALAAWRILGRELAIMEDASTLRTDYIFGSLMVGAWWALAASKGLMDWILRLTGMRLVPIAGTALLILVFTRSPSAFLGLISPDLRAWVAPWRELPAVAISIRGLLSLVAMMAFGCLAFLLHQHRPVRLADLFAWRGITWLGRISFSVYLWQNVFCFSISGTPLDFFPWNVVASIACGFIAYKLIEVPSLRVRSWVKQRFQPPAPNAVVNS
jgi:peptidoglycan/LPS O-acetylase OafA/YrhL